MVAFECAFPEPGKRENGRGSKFAIRAPAEFDREIYCTDGGGPFGAQTEMQPARASISRDPFTHPNFPRRKLFSKSGLKS